jgi:hypothetical protein
MQVGQALCKALPARPCNIAAGFAGGVCGGGRGGELRERNIDAIIPYFYLIDIRIRTGYAPAISAIPEGQQGD